MVYVLEGPEPNEASGFYLGNPSKLRYMNLERSHADMKDTQRNKRIEGVRALP